MIFALFVFSSTLSALPKEAAAWRERIPSWAKPGLGRLHDLALDKQHEYIPGDLKVLRKLVFPDGVWGVSLDSSSVHFNTQSREPRPDQMCDQKELLIKHFFTTPPKAYPEPPFLWKGVFHYPTTDIVVEKVGEEKLPSYRFFRVSDPTKVGDRLREVGSGMLYPSGSFVESTWRLWGDPANGTEKGRQIDHSLDVGLHEWKAKMVVHDPFVVVSGDDRLEYGHGTYEVIQRTSDPDDRNVRITPANAFNFPARTATHEVTSEAGRSYYFLQEIMGLIGQAGYLTKK